MHDGNYRIPKVALCTAREDHFDKNVLSYLEETGICTLSFAKNVFELDPRERFDVCVLITHWTDEVEQLKWLRSNHRSTLIVTWLWDNHIEAATDFHRQICHYSDYFFLAHSQFESLYRPFGEKFAGFIYIPSVQWDVDAAQWFLVNTWKRRSNQLYGQYFGYAEHPERDIFLEAVKSATRSRAINVATANEQNRGNYFSRDGWERFRDWSAYKVSIAMPLHNDLSSRVFDALLTGQIPLVPYSTKDLDASVSVQQQRSLPIIRFSADDPDDAVAAYRRALASFDEDGFIGAYRRHLYAARFHSGRQALYQLISSAIGLKKPEFARSASTTVRADPVSASVDI